MDVRVVVVAACVALAQTAGLGCATNEPPRLEALSIGELAEAPVPKRRFDLTFAEACGNNGITAAGDAELLRKPYLQSTTPNSTRLLWTARSAGSFTVDVTTADGETLGSFESAIDDSAVLSDASQHQVELTGLEANTLYCYTLRGADGTTMNEPAGFRTAPDPNSEEPVRFVAFGDSGVGGEGQFAVFDQIQDVAFDFVVITGDLAYQSGTLLQFERNFFDVYEPLLRSFSSFPVLGNHDNQTRDAGPFREVFALPENGGPEGREYWYSFDWGPIHFVALDTQRMGETQAAWLEADLADNDRPWTIVYTHKGPYSSGTHGSNLEFRRIFGGILMDYEVPLVLAGHDHNYERTKPIGATTYIVTGGGGKGTRGAGSAPFTAFAEGVLHFVHVTVDGPDLYMHAIDGTGTEFDFLHLVNERTLMR